MKKKILVNLMLIVMSSIMLTACGSEKADQQTQESSEKVESSEGASDVPEENDYETIPQISDLDLNDYITLGDYKGLDITSESVEPTEEEINSRIENDLKSIATTETVTGRAAKDGDIVNIDYVGKKDGVAFDGGTAEGYDLTLGSGQFIPGFEDGLIGTNTGDTVDLNLTFPENYGSSELAGADVVFTVTVNEIKERNVPELTDDTAKELNADCNNASDYKKYVADELRDSAQQDLIATQKDELLTKAVENATAKEIPGWLIRERIDYMVKSAESYASSYGMTFDDFVSQALGQTKEAFISECEQYASEDAKEALVVYAIAQAEGIEIPKEESDKQLGDYVEAMNGGTVEDFEKTVEGRVFMSFMQKDKVTEWLYENANK